MPAYKSDARKLNEAVVDEYRVVRTALVSDGTSPETRRSVPDSCFP
jgi:hypothetical protein